MSYTIPESQVIPLGMTEIWYLTILLWKQSVFISCAFSEMCSVFFPFSIPEGKLVYILNWHSPKSLFKGLFLWCTKWKRLFKRLEGMYTLTHMGLVEAWSVLKGNRCTDREVICWERTVERISNYRENLTHKKFLIIKKEIKLLLITALTCWCASD